MKYQVGFTSQRICDRIAFMDNLNVFQGFCEWFNEEVGGDLDFEGTLGLDDSFKRHFTEERQKPGVRMSNLGKPAIVSALYQLGYSEPEPRGMLRYIFFLGDVFENALEVFMRNYGFKIISSQTSDPEDTLVNWNGLPGHYDFIVEDKHGIQTLVEAKTMSGNYSRTFRTNPDDDRGYLTQLALYADAKKLPGMWICMDKSTGMIFPVQPNPLVLKERRVRARQVLSRLNKVKSLDDVLTNFKAPPPRPEVYRGNESGKMLVPQSMAWSPFKTVVYKLTDAFNGYNKTTTYVNSMADVDHMKEELDFLVENGTLIYSPPSQIGKG